MVNILRRIFSINYMLKPHQQESELPHTKDIYKLTIRTAWPSMLEAFLMGLVGLVDTIMVGALKGDLGTRAIAAIGITGQPRMILFTFIFSLNVGVTAVVARRRGENDRKRANETLYQSLAVCFVIVIIMGIFGIAFAEPFMRFAGANDDIIEFASDYFRITSVGFVFSGLGMIINAAQRGIGNTKISMHTNIIANVVNVILNFLLISGNFGFPRLEVKGAAIATAAGNFVMFLICVIKVIRKNDNGEEYNFLRLSNKIKDYIPRRDTMKSIVNVSSSALVEQLCLRVGFFIFARIIAELGTVPLSTHHMCMNILSISFTFGDGLGIASASLVGRNLGAKKPDMAIIYGKVSQRMALMVSSVLFFVFTLGRYFLIGLFTDDPNIISVGALLMIVIAIISPIQTSQVVISGSLRGAGDTKFVAVTSLVSVGILRPLFSWLFCYPLGFGLIGAWVAILFDQVLRLVLNFWRFAKGEWTKKKV